jgi:alkaline phosphatase
MLAFPDHDCGGLSIGSGEMAVDYSRTRLDYLVEPLRRMRLSAAGIKTLLGDSRDPDSIRALVRQWWDTELGDGEIRTVLALETDGLDLDYALSETFCRNHTAVGWTTHGHTGDDVPLWAFGPSAPGGTLDNTDLARVAAGALGLDLEAATAELFVDVGPEFGSFLVDTNDPYNPVLVVGQALLPLGTDLIVVGADTSAFPGTSLWYRETRRAWIPRAAVRAVRGLK